MLVSVVDVSERRRAEREAARQRDELAHLARVTTLGELSGSLAHELNQPLTAILSNAQAGQRLLERGDAAPEAMREILADIVEDDRRAGEVIRRLRSLLQKGEVQRTPVAVNAIVQDVLHLMRSDFINRNVTVVADLAPGMPLVQGDRIQLQQVVLNLLVNACDAIEGLPDRRRVTVRTRAADDAGVEMVVSDEGRGIGSGDLERVFEPFVTTKPHGMGLGLAVCRTIVTAHGGSLSAQHNDDGRGASFVVILPTSGS
jgi:C4-dicarboxylate-specific signal transduction histidine kinase